jgi:MYXO-CTERM domain-containing protein
VSYSLSSVQLVVPAPGGIGVMVLAAAARRRRRERGVQQPKGAAT